MAEQGLDPVAQTGGRGSVPSGSDFTCRLNVQLVNHYECEVWHKLESCLSSAPWQRDRFHVALGKEMRSGPDVPRTELRETSGGYGGQSV